MSEALEVIDEMIAETLGQKRRVARPVMGGAKQSMFDGEALGSFIRFTVLSEARDRITGEKRTLDEVKADFNARTNIEGMKCLDCFFGRGYHQRCPACGTHTGTHWYDHCPDMEKRDCKACAGRGTVVV